MPNYNLNYTGAQVNEGIGKAMTALQEHQSLADYRTASAQDVIDGVQNAHIGGLGNAIGMRGWNQILKNGNFEENSFYSVLNATTSVLNNECTITPSNSYFDLIIMVSSIPTGHKFYSSLEMKASENCSIFKKATASCEIEKSVGTSYARYEDISIKIDGSTTASRAIGLYSSSFPVGNTLTIKNYFVIDLTALFGSGNGPSSVSDFRAMFPADYYPYCSGSFADLLWTNASPTSSFSPQSISVDFSSYTFLCIEFVSSTSYTSYIYMAFCEKGFDINASAIDSNKIVKRPVDATGSSDSVYFSNATVCNTYGASTTNNAVLIPYKIYGVR